MGQSVEQMNRAWDYREKYEALTKRKISQDHFGPGETHLCNWLYVEFLEGALMAMEKKNIELKGKK